MKKVLFLCTGNYYRSRFGEIFFNWHAQQRGLEWKAESRGLNLMNFNEGPLSRYAQARLSKYGIPLADYQRFPLAAQHEDFDRADHIVAVKETEHRPLIEERFPTWLERVEFWEIHDVDCAAPDEAIPELEREILALVDRLAESTAARHLN